MIKNIKVEAPDFIINLLKELLECKKSLQNMELRISEIKNELMNFLGDAKSLALKGNVIAEQELTETKTFNIAKLFQDYPYLVEQLINIEPKFKIKINYDLLNQLLSEGI